jgi:hypothetical protein
MGAVATVSARALIGWRTDFGSFAQCGTNPQRSRSRCRARVSGCSRTTGASRVGAMFQVGSQFGVRFTVWNSARRASAGRKDA